MKLNELASLFNMTADDLVRKAKEFGVDLTPGGIDEVDEDIVQALRETLGASMTGPATSPAAEKTVATTPPAVPSAAPTTPPAASPSVPLQPAPAAAVSGKEKDALLQKEVSAEKKKEETAKTDVAKKQATETEAKPMAAAAAGTEKEKPSFIKTAQSLFQNKKILIMLAGGALAAAVVGFLIGSFLISKKEPPSPPVEVLPPQPPPLQPVNLEGGVRNEKELFHLIWELYSQGYFKQAHEYAQRFVEDFPESDLMADVLFKIADILFEWKRESKSLQYKEAREAYQQAVEFYPNDARVPWAIFQIGNTFYKMSLYEAASKSYRKVIEVYPTFRELDHVRYKLGVAYLMLNQHERGRMEFRWLIETFPKSVFVNNAYLRIAETFYRQKKYADAIENYMLYVDKFPESPKIHEVYYRIAKLSQVKGNFDAAIIYYRKSIGKYPNDKYNDLAELYIGNCWFQLGNFRKAREIYQLVEDKYPTTQTAGVAAVRLGDAYMKEALIPQATQAYERALEKFPTNPSAKVAAVKLGEIYFKKGMYKKMIELFTGMIAKEPNYFGNDRLLLRIAQAYFNQGDYLDASEHFLSLIKEYPASGLVRAAYFGKAKSEETALYFDKAVRSYEDFLINFPDHPRADLVLFQIGQMYFQAGKFEESIGYFENLRTKYILSDYRYEALLKIGEAYIRIAQSQVLLQDWSDKFKLSGNLEKIKKELTDKAQEAFLSVLTNKALEGSDDFFSASLKLAEFYKIQDKFALALDVINKALPLYQGQTRAYEMLRLKGILTYKLNLLDETINTYEDLISLLLEAIKDKNLSEGKRTEYQSIISEAYLALGDMLYAQDKFGEALYIYLEGIEQMPAADRKPWPFYQVANCYNRLNNFEKANFYYDKVKEEFPDNFWNDYIGWNQERIDWEKSFKK